MITLQVKSYSEGVRDAHGEIRPAFGAPRDWSVWAVAPGSMRETPDPNRDHAEIAYTVYAAKDDSVPAREDMVTVDGKDYQVDGDPADWTQGPWGASPFARVGVVVELRRDEG